MISLQDNRLKLCSVGALTKNVNHHPLLPRNPLQEEKTSLSTASALLSPPVL